MAGKKRQGTTSSTLRSSSSGRRDLTSPAPTAGRRSETQQKQHVKVVNVGCMSGIFHLVSKYHTRRKFLTFGKKAEKQAPTPAKPETGTTTTTTTLQSRNRDTSETTGRSSLEVPRSPVIPAEIRNPGTANSPRVVARLMGINDTPPSPLAATVSAEKRRKLLGALEKCDEDLKSLKRIIEAVRASQTPPPHAAVDKGRRREKAVVKEEEEREDEPSPVSVLDFARSPPSTKRARPYGQEIKQQHIQKYERQTRIRKPLPGEEDHSSNFCFLNRSSLTSTNSVINITSTLTSVFLLPPSKTRPPLINAARRTSPSSLTTLLPWSNAVVESVDEVCRDVEWGERLGVGRIGLLIQDCIFEDLLEEFTEDMMLMRRKRRMSCDYVFSSSRVFGLPFEACKRKLCF